MQRVLDSSPDILHPLPRPPAPRRSLKRTASLASLPTPPRTVHNKKRARKDFSDEDEDELEDSSSDGESSRKPLARTLFKPKGVANKAAAAAKAAEEKDVEDLFWEGSLILEQSPEQKKPKAPSTIGSAPVSPPPSRSKQVGPRFQTPQPVDERKESPKKSLRRSPRAHKSTKSPPVAEEDEGGPVRDSPNNLFLLTSKAAHSPIPAPREPEEYEEPPTISYVFRGKRQVFPNPLYNLPPEVHARSKLPLKHPEFSPSPSIRPRRLFAEELVKRGKKTKRRRSPSPSPIPTRPRRKATTIKKQRAVVPTAS